jgi:hypothetical protein
MTLSEHSRLRQPTPQRTTATSSDKLQLAWRRCTEAWTAAPEDAGAPSRYCRRTNIRNFPQGSVGKLSKQVTVFWKTGERDAAQVNDTGEARPTYTFYLVYVSERYKSLELLGVCQVGHSGRYLQQWSCLPCHPPLLKTLSCMKAWSIVSW